MRAPLVMAISTLRIDANSRIGRSGYPSTCVHPLPGELIIPSAIWSRSRLGPTLS